MFAIEVWDGPLFLNGERHIALYEQGNKRIIVSRTAEDSDEERFEHLAEAVRLAIIDQYRLVPVIGGVT